MSGVPEMSPPRADALVCAAIYFLQGQDECYRCKERSRMFAVMALPPFTFEGEQDAVMDDDGTMLRELSELPAALAVAVAPISGTLWRRDFSATASSWYWMNHWEHRDAEQGDYFVQRPNGPFWPNDDAEMQAIQAVRLEGPFRIPEAYTVYSGARADWRDRRHGVAVVAVPTRKPTKPRAKPIARYISEVHVPA